MSDDLSYLNDVLAQPTAASASSNGAEPTSTAPSLDMAALQPILDALRLANGADEDLSQLDEASIGAMLAKLDQAGVAADGIEARLDSLLGELDGMLEGLEAMQPKQKDVAISPQADLPADQKGSTSVTEQSKQSKPDA